MVTVPASGVSTPSSINSVVVLPAPFGPSSATRSPGATRHRHAVDGAHAAVLLDEAHGLENGLHAQKSSRSFVAAAIE